MSDEIECFLRSKTVVNRENVESLKEKALSLQNQLNQISKELAPHNLQKYSEELNELLKRINAVDPPNVVKFHLKKPPKNTVLRNRCNEMVNNENPRKFEVISDRDFNIMKSYNTYEGLLRCTIRGTHLYGDTGSLTFKDLELCVVNIYEPIFRHGSVSFNNCQECAIYLHTGEETQLRLHNLQKCKLAIRPSHCPQDIIMEYCGECVFDEACKSQITIHDFNDLGLAQHESRNYKFLPLQDWW